jgi:xanthine dehydrogenase accessory factor
MKELFLLIRERLQKKEPLVLVAITGSSGSTPRETGSLMLVGQGADGAPERLWGSIGGGKSEYLAIEETAFLLQRRDPSLANNSFTRQYILHSNEAAEIGAVCGGEVSVFFRLLDANEPGLLEVIKKGIACFGEGKPAWFLMEVSEGVANNALGFAGGEGFLACTGAGPQNLRDLLKSEAVYLEENGNFWLSVPIVSEGLVYIFGGGHIAQELVPLLSHLDFRCVVFDDREEFLRKDLFPQAEKLVLGDFEHIEKSLALTERDYAVIITRGHIWDLEAWAFALNSSADYIGVIGSAAKHEFVKTKLLERGFALSAINAPRVHAPIGIKIKSKTPAEIAVSIAGELILTRAR